MTHVAIVLPDLEAGGAQRVMLSLAREFVALGHRVDILLIQGGGTLQALVPPKVNVVPLCSRKDFGQTVTGLRAVLKLTMWLRRERPDAVLSTVTGTNLVAALAWKLSGAVPRLVLREVTAISRIGSRIRQIAVRRLYPEADSIVALTESMASELATVTGISSGRILCIPNPVDRALCEEAAMAPLSHPWFTEKSAPVVVSVGRLIEAKDHATLLRAFASLSKHHDARLMILGEGPQRTTIEQLIKELGIGDVVQLLGFDPNPWRWLARADLFVLSSLWEGHPNALLEALVLHRPAVATLYNDSIAKMASDFGFATVRPGDVNSMARAMRDQLVSPMRPVNLEKIPEPRDVASQYLAALTATA